MEYNSIYVGKDRRKKLHKVMTLKKSFAGCLGSSVGRASGFGFGSGGDVMGCGMSSTSGSMLSGEST